MKQFYVYIHKKPDGTPFYVGKGHGKRAYNFYCRSEWHKNIVAKYGRNNIIIEIIHCLNELQAFDLEKIYIKQLKDGGVNLVNSTDGGEGISGYLHKKDAREKIGLAQRGKVTSDYAKSVSSKIHKGNSYRKGAKHTSESKEKNRQARLGKKQSNQTVQKRIPKITKPRKSTTGITMVYWYKTGKRWVAKINVDGKQKHLGYFESYLDACAARKSAELVVYKDKLL